MLVVLQSTEIEPPAFDIQSIRIRYFRSGLLLTGNINIIIIYQVEYCISGDKFKEDATVGQATVESGIQGDNMVS